MKKVLVIIVLLIFVSLALYYSDIFYRIRPKKELGETCKHDLECGSGICITKEDIGYREKVSGSCVSSSIGFYCHVIRGRRGNCLYADSL